MPPSRAAASIETPAAAEALPPVARALARMRIIDDTTVYTSRYASISPPLLLPGRSDAPPKQLRLFEGVAPPLKTTRATTAEAEQAPEAAAAKKRGKRAAAGAANAPPPLPSLPAWSDAGCAFFAGGPVWALDWCPRRDKEREEDRDGSLPSRRRLLAVSAHPPAASTTAIGQRLSGPALVQLWSVPRYCDRGGDTGEEEEPRPLPAPSLAFALAHGGCLARDLKWRPSRSGEEDKGSLGVLAAALGDGTLTLWSVPTEAAVAAAAAARRERDERGKGPASPAASAATVLDLHPLAVGSGCGLLSSVAWCPRGSRDELATAGYDGSAVLWRVEGRPPSSCPNGESPRLVPLLRTARDPAAGPLRCVSFPPWPGVALSHPSSPPSGTGTSRPVPRLRAFATAGHSPEARLWDASDPSGGSSCLARVPLGSSRSWVLSMEWLSVPLGLVVGQDGGRLLFLPLDSGGGGGGGGGGGEGSGGKTTAETSPASKKAKKSAAASKSKGEDQKKSSHHQVPLQQRLCRAAGGAEVRDDAVWSVSHCPRTASLIAYCTSGGLVATVDVLPTAQGREAVCSSGAGQAVVSGFVPAASVANSSSSSNGNRSVVVALPLASEMPALEARAAREAHEAAKESARAIAAVDAASPPVGGRGGGKGRATAASAATTAAAADADAAAAAAGPSAPHSQRMVFSQRDGRLAVHCVRWSELTIQRRQQQQRGEGAAGGGGGGGREKDTSSAAASAGERRRSNRQRSDSLVAWSALAAGGALGVVRVHELDVERVGAGRV